MIEINFKGLNEINGAAQEFLKKLEGKKQFAVYGEMGAGKTTFIKELCGLLNVTDTVTSPTFSIINEYHTTGDYKIFHFDFYRIEEIEEVFNLGYEDYFYSEHYCFIEWPELVEELIPEHITKVRITINPDQSRKIAIG